MDVMSKDVRYHGFVTMQSRGVVALPRELRKRMHLDEPGAQLEMTEREDGVIEVRAQMAVPVTQSWFWTKEWQQREREADADIAAGRVTRYEDAESFLDALPD
jgi:bifunctional DNA-binding transcriptional regulator/antitoxin component of YhaV-PrlF toxin-antitoxin module